MKKIHLFTAIVAFAVSVGLVAPVGVFAQYYGGYSTSYGPSSGTYYGYTAPSSGYGYTAPSTPYVVGVPGVSTYYRGGCLNLTSNLYKGLSDVTTGGQVSSLQSFLISQRYLSIAVPSGYFGALTSQAVARYQQTHGLPSDGTVGVLTRASIQSVSCGNIGSNNYYNTPVLTSLSATSGAVGTSVTIYGSGFDLYNNTVNFGGVTLAGIPSYNGVALAFAVPQVGSQYYSGYNAVGNYSVSVRTSRGISNALSFTITSGNNNCYNYNNCYSGSISISNVSGPTNLTTGSQGVWSLSLYNPNSNYVSVSARWGDEGAYGYAVSAQTTQSSYVQGQQTITFTHTYQTSGYYTVVFTATDNRGAQTSVSATVNVSGSGYNQGQPYISSISPSSARVGTQVMISGSGFASNNNVVHFGVGGMTNLSALNNGTLLYYTIPSYISACDITNTSGGPYCAAPTQLVTPGTYPIYVTNSIGQTNTVYFTVTSY